MTPEQKRDAARRQHERAKLTGQQRVNERVSERKQRAKKMGVPYGMPSGRGAQREPPIPCACQMCFEPFEQRHGLWPSLDRVVPSIGYVPSNVEWIHSLCNATKETLTLEEARAKAAANPADNRWALVVAYIERHMVAQELQAA